MTVVVNHHRGDKERRGPGSPLGQTALHALDRTADEARPDCRALGISVGWGGLDSIPSLCRRANQVARVLLCWNKFLLRTVQRRSVSKRSAIASNPRGGAASARAIVAHGNHYAGLPLSARMRWPRAF
jgi:hypothetical protein